MPALSFEATVLLTIDAAQRVRQRDAAARPAGDVVDDDVVGQRDRVPARAAGSRRRVTSAPLTCCSRMPPPWPPSAKLPRITLASMVTSPAPRRHASRHRRLAADEDAAAVGRAGLLEALVEEDLVVGDHAALAEAEVADAAAVGAAVVPADEVVVHAVVVGAGADATRHRPRRPGPPGPSTVPFLVMALW